MQLQPADYLSCFTKGKVVGLIIMLDGELVSENDRNEPSDKGSAVYRLA
jgi:hypothetical protein